ncbi:protein FAR-RED IMPAIRED RESPONSE 1 isoform X2 [Ricinus communis]|uniref:protein FAR-RED IMPAIRED RESPONSE 1 isoform X2 n=1 Tax=Ricinus communis TaxID=3988 RepID=UPI00201A638E|nr:protein FAR-RED IMPAIRED RESPONSE 1 isoform X2 [Ricinus communis]
MGIDLEQPSGDYDVNANGAQDRNRVVVVNNIDGINDDKDTGPTVNGTVFDTAHKVCDAGDGSTLNAVKHLEPHDGMEFDSKEDAFSFYRDYAKSVGFATIIKASRRSRISGKFIDAKFVCTRYGNKPEEASSMTEIPHPAVDTSAASFPVKRKRGRVNRSWSKTDCKACLHVKRRQQDGRWVVRSFIKEHNHEIFPDQAYHLRGHRKLDLGNNNADALHAIRERTKKLYVSMSRQSSGHKKHESHKSSVINQSGSTQHLALEEGDAEVMLDYFTCMQDENPNFFYAIDLNEEQRLRNVFWIDSKARLDYSYFGDVIFFDTTFIKNEYKLPFAPFLGVNHHFRCLLLGSGLLSNESRSTYVWLMRAWLRAMGGHAPKVIFTDQDKFLEEAIAEVFPNSHHCFCLWHILSKIPEKLSYVIRQHENFMTKFNKCIFKSRTDEQFEKRWWKLAQRFSLRDDIWFQSLYEDRQRWIPVYTRDKFLAGISTTHRSESICSFFDKHMQRKTTLKELLEQQKLILRDKIEEEAKADFETWHKQPGLKSPSPFGKQMAALYTHAIFKKFQVEVLGVVACHPKKESEDGETKTFKVQDFEENQDYVVLWNETAPYFSCSCHLFEFSGFLCRHVLIVMQMSGMHSIPSQYVLKRWTKDAKSRETMREESDKIDSRVQRYNDLCRRAFKLGDEGSLSQESYNIAFTALEEALRKCECVNSSSLSVTESTSPSSNRPHKYEEANQANGASKINRKDGISRKRQVNPEPEVTTIMMHESCHQLGHSSLRGSARDCSYEMQESMQGMEQLSSRAQNLDGYFGPQQIVPGMGQLSSSRDDYYSNQHSMQRLGQLNAMAPLHEAQYLTQQRMPLPGMLHSRSQTISSCFDMQDGLQEMDQSNPGPSQLHNMGSKCLHPKYHSR